MTLASPVQRALATHTMALNPAKTRGPPEPG
jgi:hypothetical protein